MFIMTIDQSNISTSITPFAIPSEQEILFTMHTVFRVVEMKQTAKNNRLWEVQLTITDESDPRLAALTNRIKKEIGGGGWYRVGHFDQAEELYKELLEKASNESDRAFIYHQFGWLKADQSKYQEAITLYEKHLEIT